MQRLLKKMEPVRIAPLDCTVSNKLSGVIITNFAGPMNNFILECCCFWILIFLQGGVRDTQTNLFHVMPEGASAKVGVAETAQITKVGSHGVKNCKTGPGCGSDYQDKTAPTLDMIF